ncbi:ATP-binding protein [Amylibacter sp. SFDW26]|uniref:ATP-binding protein n=1 Tax=Amylibacter sp. SFDW26 TaxID=2652722 RepID=UPI00186A9C88|nr:ATP-binding protein [Amylibacter sp. SFDW26]
MNVRHSLFRRVLPLSVIAIGLIVLLVLFQNITTRLADLREAPNDNLSWTLSQVEVEVLLLSDAASLVGEDPSQLKDVRRRFNNLYSRVSQLRQSSVFQAMREDQQFLKYLKMLEFCTKKLVEPIDSSDDVLLTKIPDVLKELRKVRGIAHDIALTGIRLNAEETDAERADFTDLLVIAAVVSAALIGLLVIISYFLFRQHKKSQEVSAAIERASTRLKSSFDTSLDAIVVANTNGEIMEFNEAAETVFGYSATEAVGAQMADLIIPPQYHEAHHAGMKRFNDTKSPKLVGQGRIEITALRKSGEEFQIEIAIGHAEDENGSIFVAYIRDITDRLAAEEELRIARDKALDADKAKSNFLAVMSHEMRTPLNGLFGTIELLQETRLSKKQTEYIGLAKNSSDILLHHVNDVLDVSRLDAAKMDLSPKSFDLKKFFENIITTNQTTAYSKKNQLSLELGNMPDRNVWMDDHRLRQIAYNLIGNALKFTTGGQVKVKAHVTSGLELVFSVSDTGIGISEDNIEHVFEEFYTQDKSYDRMASGVGLGLAICKRIVDLMGGEISLESSLGNGTKFTVVVPLLLDDKVKEIIEIIPTSYDPKILKARRILLVEDNDINRHIVREMLEKDGVIITEATNGLEAVQMAEEQKYDLILMDVSMPVMNGIDATKEIRNSGGLSAEVPILGLTAHALPREHEKFITAGMDACLCKPISHEILAFNIEGLLTAKSRGRSIAGQENAPYYLNSNIVSEVKDALGDEKFKNILNDFQIEIDGLIKSIPQLIDASDYNELAAATHKSVGSSGVLGAECLQDSLRVIEDAAKTNAKDAIISEHSNLSDIWRITFEQLKAL